LDNQTDKNKISVPKEYPPWINVEYDGHEYVVLSKDEHKAILLGSIDGNIEFMKATDGKWAIGDNMLYVTLQQMIEKHKPESFGVASDEVDNLEE